MCIAKQWDVKASENAENAVEFQNILYVFVWLWLCLFVMHNINTYNTGHIKEEGRKLPNIILHFDELKGFCGNCHLEEKLK